MASLISGFEYDIFISYRQKDNKHDGWVTEFVKNLKGELESTFKEEISVYFDINPHDGLLETHDVNASLTEKLKCLIFIPIISRTYCDPKSFAWEHEFKAFVEMTSSDQFGPKVKLPNGNVASRILPVRIHELDTNDIKLCESLIGGVIRGIDFIYKSTGVNRPLRVGEDHPHDNLNKTYYRDQINKVANAIKDIIFCLNPRTEEQIQHPENDFVEHRIAKEIFPVSSTEHLISEEPVEIIHDKAFSYKSIFIASSIAILLLIVLCLWGWLRITPYGGNLTTYSTIPVNSPLMDPGGQYPFFSISPDGRTVAYSSVKGIELRSLSNFSTKLLEGTNGATRVGFSPDGQSIAFGQGGSLYKIGITGTPKSLVYSKGTAPGFYWGTDDYIYFSPGLGSEGIWRVSSNGGEAEQITFVIDSLGESAHTNPQLLPDSKTLLYTALGPSGGSLDSKIVIQQLKLPDRKILVDKAISGTYLSNGNLLFGKNDGNIFIVPFDLHHLRTNGEPVTVLSGVNTSTWSGSAFFSVSVNGNLIYLPRNADILNVLEVVDRFGNKIEKDTIPASTFAMMGHGWSTIRLSPQSNYLACMGRSFGSIDIWLLNLVTGDPERITFDQSEEEFPVWSPDGNLVAYTSSLSGNKWRLYIKDLGSVEKPHLFRTWSRHIHFTSWSSDKKWLAAYNYTSSNGIDCYAIPVDSGAPLPIAVSQADEMNVQFSPDCHWLAFQSNESGRYEIYVLSFPEMESKKQISIDGGTMPQWDKSGKYIYYLSNNFVIEQPVETGREFKKGKPVKMFVANATDLAVSPDGKKFYLYKMNQKRPNPPLNLITNWFEELDKEIQ